MLNISVNELERGMIIDSDIFSKRGSLLLYKGFKIENPDLVSIVLRRNGINSVSIKDDADASIAVKESDRISIKIQQEVAVFKEEFNKIVETLEEDIENFSQTRDISKIRDLDRGASFAKESESSVLTIFQLVEQIKNDGTDKYADILQISLIAYSIGKWIDLNDNQLKELSEASMLSSVFNMSDIGPDNVDTLKGAETVSQDVINSAIASRERNDGSGPMGLTDKQIPLYAKIISIAEIFYNLTSSNGFYEKMSVFDALKFMQSEYMPLLDTRILYIFLHKVANKYIGSSVKLSDGTTGVIVFVPENEIVLPFIKTPEGQIINLQSSQYKSNKIVEIV